MAEGGQLMTDQYELPFWFAMLITGWSVVAVFLLAISECVK